MSTPSAIAAISTAKQNLYLRNARARVLCYLQTSAFTPAEEQAGREKVRACQDVHELEAMYEEVVADYQRRGGVEAEQPTRSGMTIGKGEGINAF